MTTHTQPIDFVLPWVDGSDPAWQAAFRDARSSAGKDADCSEIRYRDWETLRWWFRSVERFAPWVRRIHLITWGHLPAWLERDHPKLHIVRHADYLPADYRPSFNSNTLELNLLRIDDVAEQFVLFNDDLFLLRPCRETDFFRRGLPCDMARLSLVQPSSIGHIVYNDLELINRTHARSALNRHWRKWFAPCYGLGNLLKTASLLPWSFFPGFTTHHQAQPYLLSQFRRAWEQWGEELDRSSRHTFREPTDLSHWLIRFDMLCRGEFVPRDMRDTALLTLDDTALESICNGIAAQRWRMVCLNDSEQVADFERSKKRLAAAFEQLLPDPSSYER